MRQIVAGNWKMNGSAELARRIGSRLAATGATLPCRLIVCPPATLIQALGMALAGAPVELGGQDCHAESCGPHTGDLAAPMLKEAGARWVIVGHSERRAAYGETDAQVRGKALAAQAAGLRPIICVGETQGQRAAGSETEVVGWQVEGSVPKDFVGVVAYEPIWAIGTGRVARAEEIAAMHAFIREELGRQLGAAGRDIPILYGGSVNPGNAAEILAIAQVGGALVGGASLDPDAFLAVAGAAAALSKAAGEG